MNTIIRVDSGVIAANGANGKYAPAIIAGHDGKTTYCHRADILDANGNIVASVVQPDGDCLSCGARVWIGAKFGVTLHTETALA